MTRTTEAGISRAKDEKDKLSNILNILNDKYGTEFTDADRLYFEQLEQALFENDELKLRAQNNPIENFKYAFEEVFIQTLIDRMKDNEEIFDKIMVNNEFKTDIKDWLTKKYINDSMTSQNKSQGSSIISFEINIKSKIEKASVFANN